MFINEEIKYYDEQEQWLIFWVGWLESYITNNRFQKINYHLADLKKLAKSQFISTFENYKNK